jgi:hypothetical protein
MTPDDREAILEEEVIILRNSGEIPEIALHSSLYYLEEDDEGPQVKLRNDELHLLYDATLARAQEIVLRDLDPDNRGLSIYRGPARSIANWQRLQSLCNRIDRTCPGFNETVLNALVIFMQRELEDIQQSIRTSSVNCTAEEIRLFCEELATDPGVLPEGWSCLCRD